MLFLCCLRIANVQYKRTHVRRTCLTTQWLVEEDPRRADFYVFLLPSSWAMGQCCFCVVCALPMYYTSAHTYVGLESRPSGWSEKIRVARIFLFSVCQAPWAMGQCCFCVVCAMPMYNTSAHTYVGLVSGHSGWSVDICVARIFVFSLCQAPWPMGQRCFCVVCALPMYNTSAHTYVGLVSRASWWPEKIRVARIFLFPFAKLPRQWGNVVFVLFAHCQCTIQAHTRTQDLSHDPMVGRRRSASRGFLCFPFAKLLGNGAMLFLCCLRIANVLYKCTHVRRT